MEYTEELRRILEIYREAVARVEKNKKPYDGLLGMGKKPSDDACHEQMDQGVAALIQRVAGVNDEAAGVVPADPSAVDALLSGLMHAAKEFDGPEYARIALVAAQRHGIPLIPRMTAAGRAELCAWYDKAYPRRLRFPIQKQIVDALAK